MYIYIICVHIHMFILCYTCCTDMTACAVSTILDRASAHV